MSPKHVPKCAISQAKVFYTMQWTKEVDQKFIEVLVEQSIAGNFQVGGNNTHAILVAMAEVNRQFQTSFNYGFCVERMKKLHKHYRVFNWIIHLSGVYYDLFSNVVQCSDPVWDYMCREEKLAMAYMKRGESNFNALKCIFQQGVDSESESKDSEVIQISSDTEANQLNDGVNSMVDITSIDGSEDNTDNSFWNELAWYASDSASDASLIDEYPVGSVLSTTAKVKPDVKKATGIAGPSSRCPSVEPPSSFASNSPFKKV